MGQECIKFVILIQTPEPVPEYLYYFSKTETVICIGLLLIELKGKGMKQLLSLSVFFAASGLSQATVTFLNSKFNLSKILFLLNVYLMCPFYISDKSVLLKIFFLNN